MEHTPGLSTYRVGQVVPGLWGVFLHDSTNDAPVAMADTKADALSLAQAMQSDVNDFVDQRHGPIRSSKERTEL